MPVKKTGTTKKTATAKKSTAAKSKAAPKNKPAAAPAANVLTRRPQGRPRKDTVYIEPPKPDLIVLDPEENAKKRIAGMSYAQLADLTGVAINTEGFLIVLEILRGGRDRQEINDRCRQILPAYTAQGTPKPVPNLVSGMIKKLEAKGFTIKGDWKMVKPGRGA